jgi:hypothetical protein
MTRTTVESSLRILIHHRHRKGATGVQTRAMILVHIKALRDAKLVTKTS